MNKMMIKIGYAIVTVAAAAFPLDRTLGADPGPGEPNCAAGTGWFTLFDGTAATMDKYFWLPTGQSHGTGGKWWVEGGIMYSDQVAGEGGVLFTKRKYKNVEMKVSTKLNWGNDGGIFFRSNAFGRSYQVVLDYKDGKNLGGIWGESGLHTINYKAFAFAGAGDKITATALWADSVAKAADWGTKIWKKDDFNTIHARIYKNDPPWIDSWINGVKTIFYKDNKVEDQNLTGHVGLQIHRGTDNWRAGFPNQYKTFYIRELDAEANPLPAYPEWSSVCNTGTAPGNGGRDGARIDWRFEGHRLSISGMADYDFVLSVTDIAGKVVSSVEGRAGAFVHDAGSLRSGIHFVTVRSGSSIQTVKVPSVGG